MQLLRGFLGNAQQSHVRSSQLHAQALSLQRGLHAGQNSLQHSTCHLHPDRLHDMGFAKGPLLPTVPSKLSGVYAAHAMPRLIRF